MIHVHALPVRNINNATGVVNNYSASLRLYNSAKIIAFGVSNSFCQRGKTYPLLMKNTNRKPKGTF
jgi:hypothetical protein